MIPDGYVSCYCNSILCSSQYLAMYTVNYGNKNKRKPHECGRVLGCGNLASSVQKSKLCSGLNQGKRRPFHCWGVTYSGRWGAAFQLTCTLVFSFSPGELLSSLHFLVLRLAQLCPSAVVVTCTNTVHSWVKLHVFNWLTCINMQMCQNIRAADLSTIWLTSVGLAQGQATFSYCRKGRAF